jgi:hypothetical protein
MSLTTTTLAAACGVNDQIISVTSATGFAANQPIRVDNEQMRILSTYSSGTLIPVRRGLAGSSVSAHPVKANVTTGPASDWNNPEAQTVVQYPNVRARQVMSYAASGAITLPTEGADMLAVLNGTSALAMTIADPGKDLDGSRLMICSNGAAAHTLTFASGLSGASTSYDVITINSSAPTCVEVVAINGYWQPICQPPMGGTVTNLIGSIA